VAFGDLGSSGGVGTSVTSWGSKTSGGVGINVSVS